MLCCRSMCSYPIETKAQFAVCYIDDGSDMYLINPWKQYPSSICHPHPCPKKPWVPLILEHLRGFRHNVKNLWF